MGCRVAGVLEAVLLEKAQGERSMERVGKTGEVVRRELGGSRSRSRLEEVLVDVLLLRTRGPLAALHLVPDHSPTLHHISPSSMHSQMAQDSHHTSLS